jgi:hypothetical protein
MISIKKHVKAKEFNILQPAEYTGGCRKTMTFAFYNKKRKLITVRLWDFEDRVLIKKVLTIKRSVTPKVILRMFCRMATGMATPPEMMLGMAIILNHVDLKKVYKK